MSEAPAVYDTGTIMEQVIIKGDLSKLTPIERAEYYNALCNSIGLNPLTKPFEYITLNGKLTLYALKGATDQLRRVYGVSITEIKTDLQDDLMVVTAAAADKSSRTDVDVGVVTIGHLKGDARANAIMKAITKAKRRVTLSLCGLGMLDETEVETIPNAQPARLAIEPPRPAPDAMTPDQWSDLEAIARQAYGESWQKELRQRIYEVTAGRTSRPADLTSDDARAIFERIEDELDMAGPAVPQLTPELMLDEQ